MLRYSLFAFTNKQFKILQRFNTTSTKLKPFSAIPGPKQYPFIGCLLSFKQLGGELDVQNFVALMKQVHQKYGNIVNLSFLGSKELWLFDPDHMKKVFQPEDNTPIRRLVDPWDLFHENKGLTRSLLNSQNEQWRRQRTAANPILARPSTVAQYLPMHNKIVDEFISIFKSKFRNSDNIIIEQSFHLSLKLLTFEIICSMSFDQRLNCLDLRTTSKEIIDFINIVTDFEIYSAKLLTSIPIWKIFKTTDYKIFEKLYLEILKTTEKYIHDAMDKLKNDTTILHKSEQTMLQQFLINQEKTKISTDEIVALMVDFVLAGITTTASALHNLIYELGRNQQIQDEIYEEIKNICKKDEPLTEEILSKIPLLKASVKENLRLHGIVPGAGRKLKQDIVLNDYLIPKDTNVNFIFYETARSETNFKDALKFNPKRWLDNNNDSNPFSSLPFGHGARSCVGRRIAEQEMYLIIIKLLQNFKIEYIGQEETEPLWGILLIPSKNLTIKLSKRE